MNLEVIMSLTKELIDCAGGSGTCGYLIVIDDDNAAGCKPRSEEVEGESSGRIEIDIQMDKVEKPVAEFVTAILNPTLQDVNIRKGFKQIADVLVNGIAEQPGTMGFLCVWNYVASVVTLKGVATEQGLQLQPQAIGRKRQKMAGASPIHADFRQTYWFVSLCGAEVRECLIKHIKAIVIKQCPVLLKDETGYVAEAGNLPDVSLIH